MLRVATVGGHVSNRTGIATSGGGFRTHAGTWRHRARYSRRSPWRSSESEVTSSTRHRTSPCIASHHRLRPSGGWSRNKFTTCAEHELGYTVGKISVAILLATKGTRPSEATKPDPVCGRLGQVEPVAQPAEGRIVCLLVSPSIVATPTDPRWRGASATRASKEERSFANLIPVILVQHESQRH